MNKTAITITVIIWFLVAVCTVLLCHRWAQAQWLTPEEKLELVKCIMAEADGKDAAPIAWVLRKRHQQQRHGWTFGEQTRRYCAVFDDRSPRYYGARARSIRESTWDNPLHGKPQKWGELRRWVGDFSNGEIPDPCPDAMHWRGRIDLPLPGFCRVECGETSNEFLGRCG